jgi:hypothetical protein
MFVPIISQRATHPSNIKKESDSNIYSSDVNTRGLLRKAPAQENVTIPTPYKTVVQFVIPQNMTEDNDRSVDLNNIDRIELTNAFLKFIGEGEGSTADNVPLLLEIKGIDGFSGFRSTFPPSLDSRGMAGNVCVVSAQQMNEPIILKSCQLSDGKVKALSIRVFDMAGTRIAMTGFVTFTFYLSKPQ